MGGIGNIMFQVAAAFSVSIRDNMKLIVDPTNYYGGKHGYAKYKNNILRKINFSENSLNFPSTHGERGHNYFEIPKFVEDSKLNGYFQSEKYFSNFRHDVLDLFSPTIDITTKLNTMYGEILKKNTTSLHIRRGDYLGLPNHHPVLPLEYYKTAISIFDDSQTYLIFSDDLEWCKFNLDFIENKIFVDNLEDYEELYLMSICDNNIIANSTFSWWGAWLNQNENKKVVAPNTWFGQSLDYLDTSDIYCTNWIKI